MKAAVYTRYGSPDVVTIDEVSKPKPAVGEALIKIHTTTVSRTDCGTLRGHPFFARLFMGFPYPKNPVLGMDFAGTVEAIGAGVKSFKPGDRVFGMSPDKFGAHSEYLCILENGAVASLPDGVSFDEAVVSEGAWYANCGLTYLDLGPNHSILIYGASGAIGTSAVQLAKFYGATVTAVVATEHLDLVKSLGADHVIDYTAEDFTQIGETFNFVFDAVGKTTFFRCRRLLKAGGTFAATDLGPWGQTVLLALWSTLTRSRRIAIAIPKNSEVFVDFLKARIEAGDFRAVIDRRYPLEAIVDAYRFVESERKTGIVVINVVPANESKQA